jgi:hypothetical protein
MALPALPVALVGDSIVASVSYVAFLGALAVGFCVAVVVLLERLSLDRSTFGFASLVWPWVVFFTALFGVLLLNEGEQIPRGPIADVVRTLYGYDVMWGIETTTTQFAYAAVFMLAGTGAVAVSSLLHRRTPQPTECSK